MQKFLNFEESVSRGIFETGNRIVKTLIKSSTNNGIPMPVTNESDHLKNLCILLQHIVLHGLKGLYPSFALLSPFSFLMLLMQPAKTDKRTLFGVKKTTWDLIQETFEKKKPAALANAKNMTHQSQQAKMTTWIKQALMEKELANYLLAIRADDEILRYVPQAQLHLRSTLPNFELIHLSRQWFEPFAFLRDERSSILFGMITALNSIEFNLFMKTDDKDTPPLHTDMAHYIRGEMPG